MSENIAYSERYCAFLDILGFKELIDQLSTDQSKFDRLQALLERVHSEHRPNNDNALTEIRSQSISDAVALSTSINGEALQSLFDAIRQLYIDLLVQGFLLRGAVVKGRLYHEKQTIFGEALVRAYYLETEVARFPRILVAREVRDDMLHYAGHSNIKAIFPKMTELHQSSDGPMFLHVLGPVVTLLTKDHSLNYRLTDAERETCRQYVSIRDRLQERYEEAMDTPRHFEKVRWFADYWNSMIPEKLHLRVLGFGLDPKPGTKQT